MHTDNEALIAKAVSDPVAMYGTPDAVLSDTRLDEQQKAKILQSWELDQKRLLTSEAENMIAPNPKIRPPASETLQAIKSALRKLK